MQFSNIFAETIWHGTMEQCKSVSTPMNTNDKLQAEDGGDAADEYTFRSLVGGLIYLTHSRPDIAFDVGVISRYMHKPSVYHMGATKLILRYFAGTINLGLWYAKTDSVKCIGFTDNDWASSVEDRKSTSSIVFSIGTAAVAWSTKNKR